jgi:hypothetical protein
VRWWPAWTLPQRRLQLHIALRCAGSRICAMLFVLP